MTEMPDQGESEEHKIQADHVKLSERLMQPRNSFDCQDGREYITRLAVCESFSRLKQAYRFGAPVSQICYPCTLPKPNTIGFVFCSI